MRNRLRAIIWLIVALPSVASAQTAVGRPAAHSEPVKVSGPIASAPLLEAPIAKFAGRTGTVARRGRDWWTIGLGAANGIGTVLDLRSTRGMLDRGGYESNPLYGPRPSNGRLAAIGGAWLVGQTLLVRETRRAPWWVKWPARLYVGYAVEEHLRLAARNRGVCTRKCR